MNHFIVGTFWGWDVLRVGRFRGLGCYEAWDILGLGYFGVGIFWGWDILGLGPFRA